MTSEFLTPAEVRDLTDCAHRGRQAEKLAQMGVPFKRDGERIIVSREIARRWTCGETFRQSVGPRLDLVR